MVKLTNAQATAFNSMAFNNLFTNPDRRFPIEDAFKISDFLQALAPHQRAYSDTLRGIVDANSGSINPETGLVTYKNRDDEAKAVKEIEKLNTVEIEVVGGQLTPSKEWPTLTLAEATILRPIISKNKNTSEKKKD